MASFYMKCYTGLKMGLREQKEGILVNFLWKIFKMLLNLRVICAEHIIFSEGLNEI